MKPRHYLLLSILVALVTITLKMAAWKMTQSVGYLADALETLVNVAGATFALAMVTISRRAADIDHPFGHGKAEYFSAAFEGLLIAGAAIAILYEAIGRFRQPVLLSGFSIGTVLAVLSAVLNGVMSRVLFSAAKVHRSPALMADARHLASDVWTTAGVVVGVGLATLLQLAWLDPLVAVGVALLLIREGVHLVSQATAGLMDHAIDADDLAALNAVLEAHSHHGCEFEELRTRVAGPDRFATVKLRLDGQMTLRAAHDVADLVEAEAYNQAGVHLTIHLEPKPEDG